MKDEYIHPNLKVGVHAELGRLHGLFTSVLCDSLESLSSLSPSLPPSLFILGFSSVKLPSEGQALFLF